MNNITRFRFGLVLEWVNLNGFSEGRTFNLVDVYMCLGVLGFSGLALNFFGTGFLK